MKLPRIFPAIARPLTLAAGVLTSTAVFSAPTDEPGLAFTSGENQVTLLELYTSEGCSSCPPADAWLANLLEHPGLWSEVVPVAFHVDYWNYLGWKDTLSKPAYGQRQRAYKRSGATNAVYTPGFIVNGEEWRGWFKGQKLPGPIGTAGGVLKGTLENGELCVNYSGTGPHSLEVAVLGFDLVRDIGRGENQGRTLTHQFAVLSHSTTQSDTNHWCQSLHTSNWLAPRLGLAVWVTRPGSQQPLQTAGTWLSLPTTNQDQNKL